MLHLLVSSVVLLTIVQAVPIPLTDTYARPTFDGDKYVCLTDDILFRDGDVVPAMTPCDVCKCHPPDIVCAPIKCPATPHGCKTVHTSREACCPQIVCEEKQVTQVLKTQGCEHEGRVYHNGEKVSIVEDPCEVCYCRGGEVVCTHVTCYARDDCKPVEVPGQCCPTYEHCKLIDRSTDPLTTVWPTLYSTRFRQVTSPVTTNSVIDGRHPSTSVDTENTIFVETKTTLLKRIELLGETKDAATQTLPESTAGGLLEVQTETVREDNGDKDAGVSEKTTYLPVTTSTHPESEDATYETAEEGKNNVAEDGSSTDNSDTSETETPQSNSDETTVRYSEYTPTLQGQNEDSIAENYENSTLQANGSESVAEITENSTSQDFSDDNVAASSELTVVQNLAEDSQAESTQHSTLEDSVEDSIAAGAETSAIQANIDDTIDDTNEHVAAPASESTETKYPLAELKSESVINDTEETKSQKAATDEQTSTTEVSDTSLPPKTTEGSDEDSSTVTSTSEATDTSVDVETTEGNTGAETTTHGMRMLTTASIEVTTETPAHSSTNEPWEHNRPTQMVTDDIQYVTTFDPMSPVTEMVMHITTSSPAENDEGNTTIQTNTDGNGTIASSQETEITGNIEGTTEPNTFEQLEPDVFDGKDVTISRLEGLNGSEERTLDRSTDTNVTEETVVLKELAITIQRKSENSTEIAEETPITTISSNVLSQTATTKENAVNSKYPDKDTFIDTEIAKTTDKDTEISTDNLDKKTPEGDVAPLDQIEINVTENVDTLPIFKLREEMINHQMDTVIHLITPSIEESKKSTLDITTDVTTTPDEEATTSPDEKATTSPEEEATTTSDGEATTTPDEEATTSPDEKATPSPEGEATTSPDGEATTSPEEKATTTPDGEATSSPDGEATTSPEQEATTAEASTNDDSTSKESIEAATPMVAILTTQKELIQGLEQIIEKDDAVFKTNLKELRENSGVTTNSTEETTMIMIKEIGATEEDVTLQSTTEEPEETVEQSVSAKLKNPEQETTEQLNISSMEADNKKKIVIDGTTVENIQVESKEELENITNDASTSSDIDNIENITELVENPDFQVNLTTAGSSGDFENTTMEPLTKRDDDTEKFMNENEEVETTPFSENMPDMGSSEIATESGLSVSWENINSSEAEVTQSKDVLPETVETTEGLTPDDGTADIEIKGDKIKSATTLSAATPDEHGTAYTLDTKQTDESTAISEENAKELELQVTEVSSQTNSPDGDAEPIAALQPCEGLKTVGVIESDDVTENIQTTAFPSYSESTFVESDARKGELVELNRIIKENEEFAFNKSEETTEQKSDRASNNGEHYRTPEHQSDLTPNNGEQYKATEQQSDRTSNNGEQYKATEQQSDRTSNTGGHIPKHVTDEGVQAVHVPNHFLTPPSDDGITSNVNWVHLLSTRQNEFESKPIEPASFTGNPEHAGTENVTYVIRAEIVEETTPYDSRHAVLDSFTGHYYVDNADFETATQKEAKREEAHFTPSIGNSYDRTEQFQIHHGKIFSELPTDSAHELGKYDLAVLQNFFKNFYIQNDHVQGDVE